MGNRVGAYRIYRPSAIKDILRSARERAVNPNMRTKKALADDLGITYVRLSGIEDGTSQIPLELAHSWCMAVEDEVAWKMILHIYGASIPPTDPRLIENLDRQFINFKMQSNEALEAIGNLERICLELRPGKSLDEVETEQVISNAQQVFDMIQATECVLYSLKENLGLDLGEVGRRWTLKALSSEVVLSNTQQYDAIKREAIRV